MDSESTRGCWLARYGSEPPAGVPDLASFLRHRSRRDFTGEPLPEPVVQGLVAAAQSASTSSHLQLWSVVSIQDPERREKAALLCGNQDHVRQAGLFLVFCADHHRLRKAVEKKGYDPSSLPYCEMYTMAVIDAAIAAERLVCAAESLGYGACYIGAVRNDPYGMGGLLQLPQGVAGLFGVALGAVKPGSSAEIKPRFGQESVWFREAYDPEVGSEDLDERMGPFYESQGMKREHVWSARVGRRLQEDRMTGRQAFGPYVKEQGMDLK